MSTKVFSFPAPAAEQGEASLDRLAPARRAARPANEFVRGLEIQAEAFRQVRDVLTQAHDGHGESHVFAPAASLSLDAAGQITDINPICANLLGEGRDNLLQGPFSRFVVSEDQEKWRQYLAHAWKHDESQAGGLGIRRKDGMVSCCGLYGTVVRAQGAAPTLRLVLTDISAIKRQDAPLRHREFMLEEAQHQKFTDQHEADEKLRLAASVFDNSLNGILICSPEGVILRANRMFGEITGYLPEELIGRTYHPFSSSSRDEEFFQVMLAILNRTGHWQGETWDRHQDGRSIPLWQNITAVKDDHGHLSHYIGIFSDLTERKQAARHIHRLSHYDALTDLPNRLLFNQHCTHAIERARRAGGKLAVLSLDLDEFKRVNEALGHPVGDALLKSVGQHLKHQLRQEDIVARLGGDEFMIVLENISSRGQVDTVARKLLDAFRQTFLVQDQELGVSMSIGISLYPADGKDVTDLVRYADVALYRAKNQGKGTFLYFRQ